jgi:hypothetical protein
MNRDKAKMRSEADMAILQLQDKLTGNDARRVALRYTLTNREIDKNTNVLIDLIKIEKEVQLILGQISSFPSIHRAGFADTRKSSNHCYNHYLTICYEATKNIVQSEEDLVLAYVTVQLSNSFSSLFLDPITNRTAKDRVVSKLQHMLRRKDVGFCVIERSTRRMSESPGADCAHLHILVVGQKSLIKALGNKTNANSLYDISTGANNAICFQFNRKVQTQITPYGSSVVSVKEEDKPLDIGFIDYLSKTLNLPVCVGNRNLLLVGISNKVSTMKQCRSKAQSLLFKAKKPSATVSFKIDAIKKIEKLLL